MQLSNFNPREISSLVRLLDSGEEKNIKLALSIFESNAVNEEVLDKIKKVPTLILESIKGGHQNILTQLRFIYLRRMRLKVISPHIKHLHNVIMLDLGYNQISELPPEIYALTSLKKLRLHHNQLKTLSPEISALYKLEELVLDNNQIQELPQGIKQLKNLKKLSLTRNPIHSRQIQWVQAEFPHVKLEII